MRALAAPLVAASLLGAPLAGQQDSAGPHQGFWIGFGIGAGIDASEGATPGRRGGGAALLRLGGTVNPHLLVGGDVGVWGRSENNTTHTRANVVASAQFYPSASGGFFFKSGIGFASVAIEATSGNTSVRVTDEGFGATLGVGYDHRMGRNVYVTPNVDILVQAINGQAGVVTLITVGIVWH